MANISIGGRLSLLQRVASLDLRYGPYSSIADAYENMGPSGDEVITAGLLFGVTEDDGSVSVYIWTKGEDATQADCRKLDKEHIVLFNGFIDISVFIKQQSYNDVATKDNIVFLNDRKQFAYRDGLNFYINWKNRYVWSNENLIPYDDVIYIDINDNKAYYYNGTTLALLASETFVSSINNQAPDENGNVSITKEHIGLDKVDNTSDTEKVVKGASEDGSGNNIATTYETKTDATTKQTTLQGAINALQTSVAALTGLDSTNFGGFSIKSTEADAISNIATLYTADGYTDELLWYMAGTSISSVKAYRYNGSGTPTAISSDSYDCLDFSGLIADVSTLSQNLAALGPKIDKVSVVGAQDVGEEIKVTNDEGDETLLSITDNGVDAKNLKSNAQSVLTQHQDISHLATKTEVNSKQDAIPQISEESVPSSQSDQIVITDDEDEPIVKVSDNGLWAKNISSPSIDGASALTSFECGGQSIGCVNVQMPVFDYNIVIGYGQSLAAGRGVFKQNFTQYAKCLTLYNNAFVTDYYTSYEGSYFISNIPPAKIAANTLAYHLAALYPNKKVIALNGGAGGYTIARLMDFARYGNGGTDTSVFSFPNYSASDQTSRYATLIQQLADCKAIADAEGKSIGVVAFFFMQGEQDTYAGRSDTANYTCAGDGTLWTSRFLQLKADLFADIHTIFNQERNPATFLGNLSDKWISHGNIWAAINNIIDTHEDVYAVAPKYQLPNISDGHLDTNGYRWWGEYIGKDMVSVLLHQQKPKHLRIAKAVRKGARRVEVSFSAVKLPIIVDTHTSQAMKGLGFVIRNSNMESIGNVTATLSNDIITLEVDADIPEVAYLDYGLADPVDSQHLWGAGNIKDSSDFQSFYNYMEDWDWIDGNGTWPVDYVPTDENGGSYVGKPYPLNSWLYSERVQI